MSPSPGCRHDGELQVQMQHFLKKELLVLCIPKIQAESFHHLICGLTIEGRSRDFAKNLDFE